MKNLLKLCLPLFLLLLLLSTVDVPADSKVVAVISGESYPSLQKAISAVDDGETITLLENIQTRTRVRINRPNKTFTINFAGNSYRYSGAGKAFIVRAGKVTVKNLNIVSKNYAFYVMKNANLTVTGGKCYGYHYNAGIYNIVSGSFSTRGARQSENDELIQNHGTMTIDNGNFYGITDNAIFNFGNITIKNGSYNCMAPFNGENDFYPTVFNRGKGKCNILNGNFSGNGLALLNEKGTVNIVGGTYTSTSFCVIDNIGNGNLHINNGTFTINSNEYVLLVNNNATTIISGGTFNGAVNNTSSEESKLSIYGGSFSSSYSPAIIVDMGTVEIKDGTFKTGNYNTIYVDKDGVLKIWGGIFTCTEYYYALNNYGKAYLSGGEFSSRDSADSIGSYKGSVLQVGPDVKYTGNIDYK